MSGIDTKVVSHRITIHPSAKLVAWRKRNVCKENRPAIDEDVEKLSKTRFINETNPTWLDNVVLVRKANNRSRMCVDFTGLNIFCPNDLYQFPDIDFLI